MARADVYPQPRVAYEARETVQTLSQMAPKPSPPAAKTAVPVKERVERVGQAQVLEKLPPVVEKPVAKSVSYCLVTFSSRCSLSL